jgi:multimeric flavodoxin WrbA
MKIIGINGSPRKGWNTHILVEEALKGAASKGAETELINLFELNFKGCISCFECKRKGGDTIGRCVIKDDLKLVLEKIHTCDGFIIGSPIYINEVTASVRAFFERLTFQYLSYNANQKPLFKRNIHTGIVITCNVPEKYFDQVGYSSKIKNYEELLSMIFGSAKTIISTETLTVFDYSKYEMSSIIENDRKKRREEVFPLHKQKAFALGIELTQPA